jgi:hypothetical protein
VARLAAKSLKPKSTAT